MKIYFSSFTIEALQRYIEIFPDSKLNILLSYGLRNNNFHSLFKSKNINSVILDSGTFTENFADSISVKEQISYAGYVQYLKVATKYCDFVFSYDLHFDEEKWRFNLDIFDKMKDEGFTVVPVIHSYNTLEVDEYLKRDCKIIALGYSKKFKKPQYINEMATYIYESGAKVHLLGGARLDILSKSPIHYCDSSSWVQYAYRGNVAYSDNGQQYTFKFEKNGKPDLKSHNNVTKFSQYIENETKGKLNYYDLAYGDYFNVNRQVINIRHFLNMESIITIRHATSGWNTNS